MSAIAVTFNQEARMTGKSVKLDIGTVYRKDEDGPYFFRYQVNGQRKAVSLQTKNQQEAVAKARGSSRS